MLKFTSRIKTKIIEKVYFHLVKRIRYTPSISGLSDAAPLVVLSMVRHRDIDMLLVALKSFARYVEINHFLIVTDSDVTSSDKDTLKQHLVKVKFVEASEMHCPEIPKGGTWERITAIAHACQNNYIIQIDADTITQTAPKEVIDCVVSNTAFTLGTSSGKYFQSYSEAMLVAKKQLELGNHHVQILCESLLENIADNFKEYVRGCSGFAGFPKNSIDVDSIKIVSNAYKKMIGERWNEWGTEQFTSNLLISNTCKKKVLDTDDYNTAPNPDVFHHYIGTIRFANFNFIKNTIKTINELSN